MKPQAVRRSPFYFRARAWCRAFSTGFLADAVGIAVLFAGLYVLMVGGLVLGMVFAP